MTMSDPARVRVALKVASLIGAAALMLVALFVYGLAAALLTAVVYVCGLVVASE